ncbi:unnamed protein product [Soboliphyme baturini]|uniref:F-box domain-containing protein n=1 Tax=Soboliphyme baturini TaxID=241478 RepID=A0A183IIN5_9BILA|nr:unnamed protein product [Soboliphyme baturini]
MEDREVDAAGILSSETCDSSDSNGHRNGDDDRWPTLPNLLLEKIFESLPLKYRFYASLTCRSWNYTFNCPGSWKTFVYGDYVLTRPKYTLHGAYNYYPDYYRMRALISKTSSRWHTLIIEPLTMLFNLYEFLRILTNFCDYSVQTGEEKAEPIFYGTGGQLLKASPLFLCHVTNLKSLTLRHLLLEDHEAEEFLTEMLNCFAKTLICLCVRNLTKSSRSFLHFGLFLNLRKLVISPQHLNDDVIYLLGNIAYLEDLFIVQDEYTGLATPGSSSAWKEFASRAPNVQVHLHCSGRCKMDMIWQPMAPVTSIMYSSSFSCLTIQSALTIAEYYSNTLKSYLQKGLQRRYRSKSYNERADTALLMLVRSCRHLQLLGIRERISTATAIMAAYISPNKSLKFYVRRQALLKRADYPFGPNELSSEMVNCIKVAAKSYEFTDALIGEVYGSQWRALSDNEYMHIFR